jgi:predicted secreted protein
MASTDRWEEVWAEYDARQAQAGQMLMQARGKAALQAAGGHQGAAAPSRPRRFRSWRQVVKCVLAGTLVVILWLVLPWLLALRLSAAIGQNDAPALLRQFDAPTAMASLRAGLEAEVPDGTGPGAQRFLSRMADRMAASWETPTGLAAWLSLRAQGGFAEGGPVPLSTLRAVRPLGLAAFRLEYGPNHGEGGVAFDLAWQRGDFRVVAVRFLDLPARPWPTAVLAMR